MEEVVDVSCSLAAAVATVSDAFRPRTNPPITTYLLVAPRLVANLLWVDVAMDVMLIASLFVLGGNFWDKLRALFFSDARAVFPNEATTSAAAPLATPRAG